MDLIGNEINGRGSASVNRCQAEAFPAAVITTVSSDFSSHYTAMPGLKQSVDTLPVTH
jgi:hypothetical protein